MPNFCSPREGGPASALGAMRSMTACDPKQTLGLGGCSNRSMFRYPKQEGPTTVPGEVAPHYFPFDTATLIRSAKPFVTIGRATVRAEASR